MLDERLAGTGIIEAVLDNGDIYHFIYDDVNDELMFKEKMQVIDFLVMRPNPFIVGERLERLKRKGDDPLVMDYHIDPEVVSKLVQGRKVKYSTFCADLYELPRDSAFDIQYHKRDYKRSKNKELILAQAKAGKFN